MVALPRALAHVCACAAAAPLVWSWEAPARRNDFGRTAAAARPGRAFGGDRWPPFGGSGASDTPQPGANPSSLLYV